MVLSAFSDYETLKYYLDYVYTCCCPLIYPNYLIVYTPCVHMRSFMSVEGYICVSWFILFRFLCLPLNALFLCSSISCNSQNLFTSFWPNLTGYLVINILVFDEEMEKLEKLVRRVAAAGVDALIMQVPLWSPYPGLIPPILLKTHSLSHTYTYIHIYTHTLSHEHTHTYTYTYTQSLPSFLLLHVFVPFVLLNDFNTCAQTYYK